MKTGKLLFIFSIIGILVVIFLSQILTSVYIGKIESIKSSNGNVIIEIENSSVELILFNVDFIEFEEGDVVEFSGRRDIYMGKEQIIVDKIIKTS
jgi:DNA/RNA endonuclease YhcR with UshA esterase domain